jgi:Flp pilus assembly protein TadD
MPPPKSSDLPRSSPKNGSAGQRPIGGDWKFAGLLAVATLLVYHAVWHAGFIWDDNFHVTRPELQSLEGLRRTWFEFGATEQYYPILHSAFWIEHRLWGDAPIGYHLMNVLLHALAAFLLLWVLRALRVPGAPLASLCFALHPVCVESVAWISEQKNTLSAVFYLSATLAYLRFDERRRPMGYAVALGLFLLAILSKSVTATLPAALLVVFWWKRGRLSWKRDVGPLLPWFVLAAADGVVTAWVERAFVGAHGAAYHLSIADRFLVAGRAACFYLGKLFCPVDLTFIYPRWSVNDGVAWQYLFPAALVAALALLLAIRNRSRGPLAVALLFLGTLSPALGFVNVYPFVYSYVADHFQYLAAAFLISGACAGVALGVGRLSHIPRIAARTAVVAVLATLAWASSRQSEMYATDETLWLATLAKNPACWMAYDNLGDDLLKAGRPAEAVQQYRRAVDLNPGDIESRNDLGIALMRAGTADEATAQFKRVLESDTANAEAHNNLGSLYSAQGRLVEAVAEYREAVRSDPSDIGPHYNLGNALMRGGNAREAAVEYRESLRINPGDLDSSYDLGIALMQLGQIDDAIARFQKTLELDPGYYAARINLGALFLKKERVTEAISEFEKAVEIKKDDPDARFDLAGALVQAGRLDEAIAQYRKVLENRPRDRGAHRGLGAVYFKKGMVDQADAEFQESLRP